MLRKGGHYGQFFLKFGLFFRDIFFTLLILCGKGEFENAPKGGPLWPNFVEVIILVVLVTNYDTA